MKLNKFLLICFIIIVGCQPSSSTKNVDNLLQVITDDDAGTFSIYRKGSENPILVQNAQAATRPYIHPIMAPDGKGVLTEFQPEHHLHQTGLYWGLKRVNERDFFMNWQEDHWQKASAEVIRESGSQVSWQTSYNMLDEAGEVVMTETQKWVLQDFGDKYFLDLLWTGEAKKDITFGQFYVGGLFLRMPWRKGMPGEVVNSEGQRNGKAEQQRAKWLDLGLQVDGREDLAHIAILDFPKNNDAPISWRVDGELGVGPSRQISGDWRLKKGETEKIRYRLIVYTGVLDPNELENQWENFVNEFD